jgi:hypothetical protein
LAEPLDDEARAAFEAAVEDSPVSGTLAAGILQYAAGCDIEKCEFDPWIHLTRSALTKTRLGWRKFPAK